MQATKDVSLPGVFSDAAADSLTITAASSDEGKVTVSVVSDGSKLTLGGEWLREPRRSRRRAMTAARTGACRE